MELDGRTITANETLQTDICIIGAGTAGITLAHAFINHDCKIVLLESGGLKLEKQSQLLSFGENVGHPYFPLDTARPRGFGGSTNRWFIAMGEDQFGARMRPLDSIDFEKREEIPYSGWPFSKKTLDPYYKRAEQFCRITPNGFQLMDWYDPKKTPPLNLDNKTVETVIFKFASKEPFLKRYASEIRKAENINVLLHATATEIEADENLKNILNVHVSCLGGKKFHVTAGIYVLASGGIESARLLLLSNNQQKNGLGNQHDLVGRFFMEHLHFHSGLFIPSDPDIFRKTTLYNAIHNVKEVPVLGKLALTESVQRQEKLANYVVQLKPMVAPYSRLLDFFYPSIKSSGIESLLKLYHSIGCGKIPDEMTKHLKNIWINANDVSRTVYGRLKKNLLGHFYKKKMAVYTLSHMSEQVPNPESRVTLSEEKDIFEQNRVRLNWRFSSVDIHSALRSQEIIAHEVKRAGMGQVLLTMKDELNPRPVSGGWHHMGTTRMSDDPSKGVVDSDCRVHGLSNLFIAGPSVFPTGGYANPCLTMVALVIRLSDHIKKSFGC